MLGPNGAGKSTTFNILTAKDSEFTGRALVNGGIVLESNENAWKSSGNFITSILSATYAWKERITDNRSSTFILAGVCPQFDCLWDHLNPKEHLEIYAALKGLSGKDRDEIVRYMRRKGKYCFLFFFADLLIGG